MAEPEQNRTKQSHFFARTRCDLCCSSFSAWTSCSIAAPIRKTVAGDPLKFRRAWKTNMIILNAVAISVVQQRIWWKGSRISCSPIHQLFSRDGSQAVPHNPWRHSFCKIDHVFSRGHFALIWPVNSVDEWPRERRRSEQHPITRRVFRNEGERGIADYRKGLLTDRLKRTFNCNFT